MRWHQNSVWLCVCFLSFSSITNASVFKLANDIQFIGSVVDTTPTWSWQLYPDSKAWATDWDATRNEGIVEDGKVRFEYIDKNSQGRTAFVQGVMNTPSSTGTPEILPIIKVLNVLEGESTLNGNTDIQRISIPAIGDNGSGNTLDGVLSMNIESAYTVRYKKRGDSDNIYSEAYNGEIGWAAASVVTENLPPNYGFNDNLKVMRIQYLKVDPSYSIKSILDGTNTPKDAYAILGGFTSHLGAIHTVWDSVPEQWTATLSVQVQIP